MTNITIEYFAQLRDAAGKERETFSAPSEATARQIYEQLSGSYHFPLPVDSVRMAVNDEFVDDNHVLQNGDKLVFIPPVAGG